MSGRARSPRPAIPQAAVSARAPASRPDPAPRCYACLVPLRLLAQDRLRGSHCSLAVHDLLIGLGQRGLSGQVEPLLREIELLLSDQRIARERLDVARPERVEDRLIEI